MSARVWSSLQRKSSHGKSGWQLVGRGEASDVTPNDKRTVRSLSYKEVSEMPADEAAWHMKHNTQAWQAAFEEEERRRGSKIHVAKTKVELMWSGHATPEEDEASRQAGALFAKRTPTFPRTIEAATLVPDFMKQNLMDATRVESYVKAFRQLVEDGKIQPVPYQSADAFYHEHKELHPTQKPPLIQAKEAKAEATKAAFANAESNTASAGVTHFTDYPERERVGYGNHTRYSFRKLLDSLDADSYQRRLIEDKAFAAAVDRIQNEK